MKKIIYIVNIFALIFLVTGCGNGGIKAVNASRAGHLVKIEVASKKFKNEKKITIDFSYGHSYEDTDREHSKVNYIYIIVKEELFLFKEVPSDFYTDKYYVKVGYWIWQIQNSKFNYTEEHIIDFSKYEVGESGKIEIILSDLKYDLKKKDFIYDSNTENGDCAKLFIDFSIEDNAIYFE